MFNFLKILLSFLFWIVVFILLYITFFVDQYTNQTFDDSELSKSDSWYSLFLSGSELFRWDLDDNNKNIFSEKLNDTDRIYYSSKWSYTFSNNDKEVNIDILNWIFIFDLNDLTKTYNINSKGFNLKPLEWGLIYVDVNDDKVLVFSISSITNLSFINLDSLKELNNIYLFPHSYIKFNPYSNEESQLGNDLFRIETSRMNWYFPDSFFSKDYYEKQDSLNIFYETWLNFIETVKQDIIKQTKQISSDFAKLKSIKPSIFFWTEYIEKYLFLFINDGKKAVYYKNIIFNDLIILLNSEKEDEEKINDIKDSLITLKSIDYKAYEEMNLLIKKYYIIISQYKPIGESKAIYNFTSLISKLDNINLNKEINFLAYLYLRNLYHNYDFVWNISLFNKSFLVFLDKFYQNLDLTNDNIIIFWETNKKLIESLLVFLENYIKINLFNNVSDISSDVNIFSKYIPLNKTIYFSLNDEKAIETGLEKNRELINKISDFFSNYVFNSQRDDKTGLLIENKTINLDIDSLVLLKNILDKLFKLADTYKADLDYNTKTESLFRFYTTYKTNLDEYLLALTDIDLYSKTYSDLYKKLNNYSVEVKTDEYSSSDLISYFSYFNWLSLSNLKIEKITENNYFKVDWLIVNNNVFSFDIYPDQYFRIENIKINWEENIYSYELETEKTIWEEKYDSLDGEDPDKEKYNFKNFFLQTFFAGPSSTSIVTVWETTASWYTEEDKIIAAFKRDILLAKDWEFSSLQDVLKIDYEDLIVPDLENIYLSWAMLNFSIGQNKDKVDYISDFSSKYYIDSETKNNYFYGGEKDILIKLYNIWKDKKINWYLLWGQDIKIRWKIYKRDFVKTFTYVFETMPYVLSLFNEINTYTSYWSSIDITYQVWTWKFSFKFENNQKTINIYLLWENVVYILVDWRKYLNTPIKYNEILDILWEIN